MNRINLYLNAAERINTRRSYASAIRHFEVEWGGLLPATIDSIAHYLSDHAGSLSFNTLKHRLAALSRWHQAYGFADPTKAAKIRQLLKGIRSLHPAQEKRAKPLELGILQSASDWLVSATAVATARGDATAVLRYTRDRALVLLGFWRGFRSDELSNLRIEFMEIKPDEGLTCYLPHSKSDRQLEGRRFSCPALSRLCPVKAVEDWLVASQLKDGPLFRRIDRWGHLADVGLIPGSIISMLRKLLTQTGVDDADAFSSHSLRRGFAHWARQSGWDIRELMTYVGWRDVKTAMRYLEGADVGLKERFEQGLVASPQKPTPKLPDLPEVALASIEVSLQLSAFNGSKHNQTRALREMTENCLARFQAHPINGDRSRYRIAVPNPSPDILDDQLYTLVDELHQIANARACFLEVVCRDPKSGKHWD